MACKTETVVEPETDNQINTETLEDLEVPHILHSQKVRLSPMFSTGALYDILTRK